MRETTTLINKKVLLFTRNNFRYVGTITNIDEVFIYIFDIKEQKIILINKTEIQTIEVQE